MAIMHEIDVAIFLMHISSLLLCVLFFLYVNCGFAKSSMHSLFGQRRLTLFRSTFRGLLSHHSSVNVTGKPNVIFVLGGPGAGKGTQCKKLAQEFNIKHLSAGELLREEQQRPTENGRLIDSYLKEGKIVPVEVSLSLLRKAIVDMKWNRYLIDGFPRNWDNLEGWNSTMTDVCNVEAVLFIECNEKELQKRILSRGESSGRDDDNLVSLKKRFATFKKETLPVVEHFKKKLTGRFVAVNGDQPVDKVYDDLVVPVKKAITAEITGLTKSIVDGKTKFGEKVEFVEARDVAFRKEGVYISYRYETTDKDNSEWLKIDFAEKLWSFQDGQWTHSDYLGDWPPLEEQPNLDNILDSLESAK